MEDKRVKKLPKKHLWKPEEDLILKKYVETHGEGNWATVSQQSGLMRGGKSCRLRWKNYLRPNIKRGGMSQEEEDLIIRMHKLIGNRWSLIAGRLPGRTDNEVKNYWNTHLNKSSPRRRRKLSANKNIIQNDSHSPKTTSKKNETQDPHTTITESPNTTATDKIEQRKEEENSSLLNPSSSMGDTTGFNYGIESPIMAGNSAMFAFDDVPLPTYLDSFLFFEAFGCTSGEESYAEIGMRSVIP